MSPKKIFSAAACALTLGSPAFALPTLLTSTEIFFAVDQAPGQTVTQTVRNKRLEFEQQLAPGFSSYGFEDKNDLQAAPFSVSFTGGLAAGNSPFTATLQGSGRVRQDPESGRYDTTTANASGKYWEVEAGPNRIFSIDFGTNRPVSAFGFYGTDVGDFLGGISIILTPVVGAEETVVIHREGLATAGGSLLFWGFASRNRSYSRIRFEATGPSGNDADFFGFDDFIVADLAPLAAGVPEPASLALVGLGLLGAAAARRRRG